MLQPRAPLVTDTKVWIIDQDLHFKENMQIYSEIGWPHSHILSPFIFLQIL